MPTPVLDALNVKLAYLLGDPYVPGTGAVVTATDDGISYSAVLRDQFLTDAVRMVVSRYGVVALKERDLRESYCRKVQITANPYTVPTDLHRILSLSYYGKKLMTRPLPDGRDASVYWQNAPYFEYDPGTGVMTFFNCRAPGTFAATMWYQRTVPNLTHNGTEDILLGPMFYPIILSFAEALGRRTHQELGTLTKQDAIGELQSMKDAD